MQLLLIVAVAMLMAFSITTKFAHDKIDRPAAAKQALVEVNRFRTFMFVANQYMNTVTVAPSAITTIPWSTMASSSVTPPGMRSMSMPATWRVVQATDKSWVACTEMDERSVSAVGQLVAATSTVNGSGTVVVSPAPAALVPVSIGGTGFVVIGTEATAVAQATLCN